MAHRNECRTGAVADRCLECDALPIIVTKTRSIDRRLQVHPEEEVVQKQLHVSLRLNTTAHQAEAHVRLLAPIDGAGYKSGNERMERAFAWRSSIWKIGREREPGAAIV